MARDSLKPEEEALLREVVTKRQPSLLPLISDLEANPLTSSQLEAVREILCEELAETGLRLDYEPTTRGLHLDNLIGRLWNFSTEAE